MSNSLDKKGLSISAAIAAALLVSSAATVAQKGGGEIKYADPGKHFDTLGKPPSEHTLKAIAKDAAGLPFDDTRDFDEADKGFIAAPDSWVVKGPAGNTVWDLERYKFFLRDTDFQRANKLRSDFIRKAFSELGFTGDELEMRTMLFTCYHTWEASMFPGVSRKRRKELIGKRLDLLTAKLPS
mgnify:FL=1